jgi:hypothetical protein
MRRGLGPASRRAIALLALNMHAGRRNPNARIFTSCERAAAKKVTG